MATMTMAAETQQQIIPAKLCRLCGSGLQHTFVDLGVSPLARAIFPKPT